MSVMPSPSKSPSARIVALPGPCTLAALAADRPFMSHTALPPALVHARSLRASRLKSRRAPLATAIGGRAATTCETAEDVPGPYDEEPPYSAVSVCVPAGNAVVQAACPPEIATAVQPAMSLPLLRKRTTPSDTGVKLPLT